MKNRSLLVVLSVSLLAAPSVSAQSSPYCDADINFDNTLNFFDVSEFLALIIAGDPAADFTGDGRINFFDVSHFLTSFNQTCPDLLDSDGDRLPDFVETDNGLYVDIFSTGTDPFDPDTDNDGIKDGDETLGTAEGLDLPAMGADPLRKDIFVECDWFEGVFQGRSENYRPTPAVEARVVACFADASTQNPYGLPDGINIHLDYGQGGAFTGGNRLPGEPVFLLFDYEFNMLKDDHFADNRRGYFHYAIFANRYNSSTNGSSGIAEVNGNDFMVTMVGFNSTNNMANTIVHELGHNLGLRHGGFENRNRKPNYNSVMNYRHQFPGVDTDGDARGDGVLDYSRGLNVDLDEDAIVEALGVNGIDGIDWDGDRSISSVPYAANVNCSGSISPCGTTGSCADSSCDVLRDHDDWANINWSRLTASFDRTTPPEIIGCQNWPGK